ncbi:MAG: electron transfer flavoprotein subunit beta/FixA family protein, partial [Candidatus Eremiobacteraeota bacterium]|nr:electron transfer flavoprotein subunit beta/FixA family protein [Candidatus Eremiobacteraeota bacterium]
MKIIVLIKQVPDTEAQIKIDSSGKAIEESGIKFVLNPYDEFAVEEAVRIKEKIPGSTVSVITVGPERAKEAVRSALAMGADTGIRIWDDSLKGADTVVIGKILATAIKSMEYDLILCGKQAIDEDRGITGGALANLLSIPFVSNVVKVNLENDCCSLQREIEGASEIVEAKLPCIISAQKG